MRCIILSCETKLSKCGNVGLSSHRLPKRLKKRVAWLNVLDPSGTYYRVTDSSRLCSLHFLGSDFCTRNGKPKLKSSAIPSVDLGPAAEQPLSKSASDVDHPALHRTQKPIIGREPWDIPARIPVRLKMPETVIVEPTLSVKDLKNAPIETLSPRLAHNVLPKVYKQLQHAKILLSRYKRQYTYYREQNTQLRNILTEISTQHGIPIPKHVWMSSKIHPALERRSMDPLPADDMEISDPLAVTGEVEIKIEPTELMEEVVQQVGISKDARDEKDEDEVSDSDEGDMYGARYEDDAVKTLMEML